MHEYLSMLVERACLPSMKRRKTTNLAAEFRPTARARTMNVATLTLCLLKLARQALEGRRRAKGGEKEDEKHCMNPVPDYRICMDISST